MKPADHRAVAKQVYDFAASQAPLAPLVKEALGVIDDAIDSFGYAHAPALIFAPWLTSASQDHISISFNGGKDCESSLRSGQASRDVRLQTLRTTYHLHASRPGKAPACATVY